MSHSSAKTLDGNRGNGSSPTYKKRNETPVFLAARRALRSRARNERCGLPCKLAPWPPAAKASTDNAAVLGDHVSYRASGPGSNVSARLTPADSSSKECSLKVEL
jgi:hypothetical protein